MNRKIDESNVGYAARMWALCVGLPCIVLCLIGFVACAAEASAYKPSGDARCFSAQHWGPVSDSVRPCAKVVPNQPEAGALRFTVSDASGIVRYSGFINTPFNRVFHAWITRLYEDGSFCYLAINWTGTPDRGCVGNLED